MASARLKLGPKNFSPGTAQADAGDDNDFLLVELESFPSEISLSEETDPVPLEHHFQSGCFLKWASLTLKASSLYFSFSSLPKLYHHSPSICV